MIIKVYKRVLDGSDAIGKKYKLEKFVEITEWMDFNYIEKEDINEFTLVMTPDSISSGVNAEFWREMFAENMDVVNQTYIIENGDNDKQSGIITSIEMAFADEGEGTKFTFKGYGLEFLFKSRIISPDDELDADGNYTFENQTYRAITNKIFENFINGETASTGFLDGGLINHQKRLTSVLAGIEYLDDDDDTTYTVSWRLKTAYEMMKELITMAKERDKNKYIYGKIQDNKIKFFSAQQRDKTDIIFDNWYKKNLVSTTITKDGEEQYNAWISAGTGEGAERIEGFGILGGEEYSDLKYNELFVDASTASTGADAGRMGYTAVMETKTSEEIETKLDNKLFGNEVGGIRINDIVRAEIYYNVTTPMGEEIEYNINYEVPIIEIGYSYAKNYIEYDIKMGEKIALTSNYETNERKNARNSSRR